MRQRRNAKQSLDSLRAGTQCGRRSRPSDPAALENEHLIGEIQSGADPLLDEQDGHIAARCEPRQRLMRGFRIR